MQFFNSLYYYLIFNWFHNFKASKLLDSFNEEEGDNNGDNYLFSLNNL